MPLTVQQIREILKEKPTKNKGIIPKATLHESRLRFHGETTLSRHDCSVAITHHFNLVKKILPRDKYTTYLALFQFPVATVPLLDEIYCALEKIWDGRNPVFRYEFVSPEHAQDWENYRNNVLGVMNFWKHKGFQKMKTSINCVQIVDLPQEQKSELPEPYQYFLNIGNVIDFDTTDGTQMKWIIFKQSNDRLAVFDDQTYRIFKTKKGAIKEIDPTPEIETSHELGYCPARFFWTTPLNDKHETLKKSPISNQLGKLEMLLFYILSNEHLNIYGRYPIYWGFARDCDFSDEETGNYCDGGFLRDENELYLFTMVDGGRTLKVCPICDQKRFDGAGSFIDVDPPGPENNNADLREPGGIIGINRESLDYNNEDVAARSANVYQSVTGFQGLTLHKEAINERQVTAVFESREAALRNPQQNFEAAISWGDSTIARLRYGTELFISGSVSLGTEHYILSPAEIMTLYNDAKKAAFSVSTLDMLEGQYFDTQYQNNPEQRQRQYVISHLDPFRHLSNSEVSTLHQNKQIDFLDFLTKVNFSSFIMKFERENLPITEFGSGVAFDKKIQAIKNEFRRYAEEMKPSVVAPPPVE